MALRPYKDYDPDDDTIYDDDPIRPLTQDDIDNMSSVFTVPASLVPRIIRSGKAQRREQDLDEKGEGQRGRKE